MDQDNKPISSARVKGAVTGDAVLRHQSTRKPVEAITDENGLFEFLGHSGRGIVIEKILKTNYVDFIRFDGTTFSFISSAPFVPNRNNPVVFRIGEIPGEYSLKKGSRFVRIHNYGQPYQIDLLKHGGLRENDGPLDFEITVDQPDSSTTNGTWNVVLTASNGGIQEAVERHNFYAPSTGYTDSLSYQVSEGTYALEKVFYVKSRADERYSWVDMSLMFGSEKSAVQFHFVMNESGTRLLHR